MRYMYDALKDYIERGQFVDVGILLHKILEERISCTHHDDEIPAEVERATLTVIAALEGEL